MLARFRWCSALALCACGAPFADTRMLTQEQLSDSAAVIRQRKSADAALKSEAASWLKTADAAVREGKWDAARKAYGEAALRYPTFTSLRGYGSAMARSNRARATKQESIESHKQAFSSAVPVLKIAAELAPQDRAAQKDINAVSKEVSCLESYLKTGATCEPVASVLGRYR